QHFVSLNFLFDNLLRFRSQKDRN
ncbi:hypothetical protein pipiens_003275, partial [Culex pipiens pipiens]